MPVLLAHTVREMQAHAFRKVAMNEQLDSTRLKVHRVAVDTCQFMLTWRNPNTVAPF